MIMFLKPHQGSLKGYPCAQNVIKYHNMVLMTSIRFGGMQKNPSLIANFNYLKSLYLEVT